MSEHIDREKLNTTLRGMLAKEKELMSKAKHKRHFEEAAMFNHAANVLKKAILLVNGMEAEDAETKTD